MTFDEWKAEVTKELTAAGFTVEEYQNLPIIKEPLTLDQRYKLLKLRSTLPMCKTIYAEGCIITPERIK